MTRKYDSTVARIAGNILSGWDPGNFKQNDLAVRWAVGMARAIVAETERTSPLTAAARRAVAAGGAHDCGEWVTATGDCALCDKPVDVGRPFGVGGAE